MTLQSTIKLNNGIEIPALGLGTYLTNPGKEARYSVLTALELGYRHIDTAAFYANEEDIGAAVRESGVPRNEIFVTTKLWNSDHGTDKARKAFDTSMKKLKLDYIDLYLIHWPLEDKRRETWLALEKIYESGACRSIGVSNYTIRHIEELLEYSSVVPVANQVEFHAYLYQKELLDYCKSKGIVLEAYTPLVRGKKFGDPKLKSFAQKYGKTPAQMLIRWTLQLGIVTLPKSVHRERIAENAEVFDFDISPEDMAEMNRLHCDYRVCWDPSNIK
ncbi:MAG: Aldo/keto reductase [Ignavibacteria bacterium]|nr:Aldo/keto reductase [Ignavibacteria bacterium]